MRRGIALAAALLLAACQSTEPVTSFTHRAPKHRSHRTLQARRMDQQSSAVVTIGAVEVPLQWSFSTQAGDCVADAVSEGRSPSLQLRVDRGVHVIVLRRGYSGRFGFTGPGGTWAFRSPDRGRDATANLPLNASTLSELRKMLEGGRLRFLDGYPPTTLVIPDAGVSGLDWLGCATAKLHGGSGAAPR